MKSTRQNAILELIRDQDIETQEDLADALRKRDFKVTQATVSRDIRELKLTKVQKENGRQCYAVMQARQDFGLRDVEFVVGKVRHLGIVHVEGQPVIDHAERKRIPAFPDGQAVLAEAHIGANERQLCVGGLLPVGHVGLQL